jgi:hypothetical protein
VTELDPYAVIGVPRTASREEIARAYRRMAKRFHPDADTGAPHASMARINEAWRILSDAASRARWDRAHTIVEPAPWMQPGTRRAPTRPATPPETRDSPWLAVAVVGGAALLMGVVVVGIGLVSATPSAGDQPRFETDAMSFQNPHDWVIAAGEADQPADHRVLAHVVTFGIEPFSPCTSFADPCELTADVIPPGAASIVITAWETGTPPVPDPIRRRPYGLDAQRIIGDEPAAFRLRRLTDSATAWWQLSPPGFPDRWIEVEATIGGQVLEQNAAMARIEGMLATVEFSR